MLLKLSLSVSDAGSTAMDKHQKRQFDAKELVQMNAKAGKQQRMSAAIGVSKSPISGFFFWVQSIPICSTCPSLEFPSPFFIFLLKLSYSFPSKLAPQVCGPECKDLTYFSSLVYKPYTRRQKGRCRPQHQPLKP